MNFDVTSTNNFCRVFRMPDQFSEQFCFDGPIPHTFFMVDWFNPIPVDPPGDTEGKWPKVYPFTMSLQKIRDHLVPWLLKKPYVKDGGTYLVLCDFGACFTFQN